jgi:hypothetical protein
MIEGIVYNNELTTVQNALGDLLLRGQVADLAIVLTIGRLLGKTFNEVGAIHTESLSCACALMLAQRQGG